MVERIGVTTLGLHQMGEDVEAIALHTYPKLHKPCGELQDLVHARAGKGLRDEMEAMGVERHEMVRGDVRVTGGHRLPAQWVIHCIAPGWEGVGCEEQLAACYRNVLREAADREVGILAVRRMSGSFPTRLGAQIALGEAVRHLNENEWPRRVVFSLWESPEEIDTWKEVRDELGG